MKVLVACEYSGRVRDAFARRGHTAVSVDLLPSDSGGWHYRGDILRFIRQYPNWDLLVGFPPCTYLSNVGTSKWSEREQDGLQDEAMNFFLDLWDCGIPKVALENPAGRMSTLWRKPNQYVQPWWFGDPWIKRTGLWLKNLPELVPSKVVKPYGHWVDGGTMWKRGLVRSEHEGSYMNALSTTNSKRAHERAKTFPGLARAMARQWG